MVDPSTLLLLALVAPGISLLASTVALVTCALPVFLRATSSSAAEFITAVPLLESMADNRGLVFAISGAILAFAGLLTLFRRVREKQKVLLFAMTVNGLSTMIYAAAFCLAYFPFAFIA